MQTIAPGEKVKFEPLFETDEIYMYDMPDIGSIGEVTRVAIDPAFLNMWGILFVLCEVDFGQIGPKMVYLEDLKLV